MSGWAPWMVLSNPLFIASPASPPRECPISSGGMWQWIHNLAHFRFHRALLVNQPPRTAKAKCSFQRSPIWSGALCRSCEDGKHATSSGGKEWAGSGSCTFGNAGWNWCYTQAVCNSSADAGTAQRNQEEQQAEEGSISGCCKMNTAASLSVVAALVSRGRAKVQLSPHCSERTIEIQCFKQTIASLYNVPADARSSEQKHGKKWENRKMKVDMYMT